MTEYYRIVPWFSTKEWFEVYDNLYSENVMLENQHNALKSLLIWKARCPFLPSGIESTLSLLDVCIQDTKAVDSTDDHLLRLAYSSAIMRFVNHMFDSESVKGKSLYNIAQNRGVPDWIVDLRHDTAHSNNLPSLELLREATSICLQWLRNNYWLLHKEILKDCVVNKSEMLRIRIEENVPTLINLWTMISFLAHPNCKVKILSRIPQDLQQSMISDINALFGNAINLSRLETISVQSLIIQLKMHSEKIISNIKKDQLVKMLLDDESLFLSTEVYKVMSNKKRGLDSVYVKCFEIFLQFLSSYDLLQEFTLEIIKLTEPNKIDNERCKLAAKWVSQILKSLKNTQMFLERIAEKKLDIQNRTTKDLQSLFNHWFPNEKSSPLFLDLKKPIPSCLTDINVIRSIITNYNPNLIFFISDLLHLVRPKLPISVRRKIRTLAQLISSPQGFSAESNKIYTIEDFITEDIKIENNVSDKFKEHNILNVNEYQEDCREFGIWKKACADTRWSSTPIGLLPWQKHLSNEMEVDQ